MKKAILFILCLLYSPPIFADRLSELERQVAKQQEQIQMLQRQMESLVGEKGEQPLIEQSETISKETPGREPRVSFKVKPGFNMLSFQARRSDAHWRENTAGFGTSAELELRIFDPLRFNLTFDGAILSETGSLQRDDVGGNGFGNTRTRLYTGSPNIKYRVFSSERVSADMSLGYDFVGSQVRERNIRTFLTTSAASTTARGKSTTGQISTTAKEKSDLFGHGPRVGIATKFYPSKKLSFGAEGFYTSFFDMHWEDTLVGSFPTEGHAFRWDLGVDYSLTKRLTLGGGYRGYILHTDLSTTEINDINIFFPESVTRSDHIYFSAGIKY